MNDFDFVNTVIEGIFGYKPFNGSSWTVTNTAKDENTMGYTRSLYDNVNMPAVKSVIFNKNATIVYFEDGTKCIVRKSAFDEYNREHAVVYAIVKRAYGFVNDDGTVEGNGMGSMLAKIVANGYDQEAHEIEKKAKNKKSNNAEPWKYECRDSKGRFVKKANRK